MRLNPFTYEKTLESSRLLMRAFHYRNFRLFFAGQSLSLIGTWMQHTAMSWLVYRLTGSASMLGVVIFSGQIFSLVLTPVAGVYADRLDRRKLLLATQSLATLQAVILAALYMTGMLRVWHIISLSAFLGMVSSFEVPARHSFVADLVDDRKDLVNAVALNSSMFHGARLIGPAVAGILIRAAGEGLCFLFNAASFAAVILALTAIRIKPHIKFVSGQAVAKDFMDSLGYVYRVKRIKIIILLIAAIGLLGMPLTVLLPVFARDILGGGPETLGLLMGFSGMGALAGTLYLASRAGLVPVSRLIGRTSILFGTGMAAFALSQFLWLSSTLMVLTGFGIVSQVAAGNAWIQVTVEENKRGRVMALFNMAFLGMTPFGSLLAGLMADSIGAQATLLIDAVLFLIISHLLIRNIHD